MISAADSNTELPEIMIPIDNGIIPELKISRHLFMKRSSVEII